MSVHRLDEAALFTDSSSLLSSPLEMSSYATALPHSSVLSAGGPNAEAEWPPEGIVNVHDLGKGVGWALAIEGAAALAICLVWHLWHVL